MISQHSILLFACLKSFGFLNVWCFVNFSLFSHFIELIHTEATSSCENYLNHLCKKTWTAAGDSQLMVIHVHILLRIELLKNLFF